MGVKSQTISFLLTVQLSPGYDDDYKGRLLSSTAIVKRFQTEKFTRATGSHSRWNFATMWFQTAVVGLQDRE